MPSTQDRPDSKRRWVYTYFIAHHQLEDISSENVKVDFSIKKPPIVVTLPNGCACVFISFDKSEFSQIPDFFKTSEEFKYAEMYMNDFSEMSFMLVLGRGRDVKRVEFDVALENIFAINSTFYPRLNTASKLFRNNSIPFFIQAVQDDILMLRSHKARYGKYLLHHIDFNMTPLDFDLSFDDYVYHHNNNFPYLEVTCVINDFDTETLYLSLRDENRWAFSKTAPLSKA